MRPDIPDKMKVSIAQINCVLGALDSNLLKISTFCKTAAREGSELIIFPEISELGYDMKVITTSIFDEFHIEEKISEIAKSNNILIAIGLRHKENSEIYNTQKIFDPDGSICLYKKNYLFSGKPVCENLHLSSGDELLITEFGEFKTASMICYDIRFPELARKYTRSGVDLFLVSAAWPKIRTEHWITLLKARAIENQAYILASNRCGIDSGLEFAGCSVIISPNGDIVRIADNLKEELIYAEIKKENVLKIRKTFSVLQDIKDNI